jgi:acetyl esterase/lipase
VARALRISLRAELARLGLRYFVKRRSHRQTLADARDNFRHMEALVPKPPAGTRTTRVDADGVTADRVSRPASRNDRHLLFLHGGGYRLGSPATYRHFTWRLADAARANVLAIDYRLAPEHPFPAALDDAFTAYRWLIACGAPPERLVVAGDSAGGGLTFALMMMLRDAGLPLPAAAVAMSPWTDLALTGPSLMRNARADPMLNAEDLPQYSADYLGGADPRTPYASPLYGDPAGLPPTLIQVGGDEILRDDAVRMAEAMRAAGSTVDLEVWPRMPHVWQLLAPMVPEAGAAINRIGGFVERALAAQK